MPIAPSDGHFAVYGKVEMKLRAFVIFAAVLFGQNCLADWTAGSTAFQDGNFQVALRHFEAEIQAGLDSPAVHYNVAVCHFKLQQYEESRTSFQLIANRYPKMRGLAEYNLGLIDRRKNDAQAATSHFLKAYELSPNDQKLRILASARLRELEPELGVPSEWSGALGMRAGFDDNVALRDETGLPSTATTDSPFADFFASINGPYNGVSGFRFDGSIYVVRNFDADDFDQAGIYGGAMYDWRPGEWRLQLGLHTSAGTLGGDSFDRKAGGNFRAVRYLNDNAEFDISFIYDDVQESSARFAGIAGSRQQLQGRYRWYSGGRRFFLRYRLEENDRLDPQVSPKRKSLSADYRYQPDTGWGYEAGLSYRTSRFDQMTEQRDEDLATANVGAIRSIGQEWLLLIKYQYSNNDSSDPVFSYDRSVLSVGAMRLF
jgi:hypothetical protein